MSGEKDKELITVQGEEVGHQWLEGMQDYTVWEQLLNPELISITPFHETFEAAYKKYYS